MSAPHYMSDGQNEHDQLRALTMRIAAAFALHREHLDRTPPVVMDRCECLGCRMARALGWDGSPPADDTRSTAQQHSDGTQ